MNNYDVTECTKCNGSGSDLYTGEDCEVCLGTGFILKDYPLDGDNDNYFKAVRQAILTTVRPKADLLDY